MFKEHLILLTRKKRINNQFAIIPEELIASTFCLMMQQTQLDSNQCTDLLCDEKDSITGQYPLLIYRHWVVPRKYIFSFFKMATKIDEKSHTLNPELQRQIQNLIDLLSNRLSIVIVSFLLFLHALEAQLCRALVIRHTPPSKSPLKQSVRPFYPVESIRKGISSFSISRASF